MWFLKKKLCGLEVQEAGGERQSVKSCWIGRWTWNLRHSCTGVGKGKDGASTVHLKIVESSSEK